MITIFKEEADQLMQKLLGYRQFINSYNADCIELEKKLMKFLDERKWDSYVSSDKNIKVVVTDKIVESINKDQLRIVLHPGDYEKVIDRMSERTIVIMDNNKKLKLTRSKLRKVTNIE